MRPWQVIGFSGTAADGGEKIALSMSDILSGISNTASSAGSSIASAASQVPREVWGGLGGGAVGGLGGYALTQDETTRKRNAALAALAGAVLGAGATHYLMKPSPPKLENQPGSAPTRPQQPEAGKLPSQSVEPTYQRSEAAARQQAQQGATQQAIQMSTARERAALLRDQGQVAARMQALMSPRIAPTPGKPPMVIGKPPGVGKPPTAPGHPRVSYIAPGVRFVPFARGSAPIPAALSKSGSARPDVDYAVILDFIREHPKLAAFMPTSGVFS